MKIIIFGKTQVDILGMKPGRRRVDACRSRSQRECDLDLDQTVKSEFPQTTSNALPSLSPVRSKAVWVLIYIFSYSVSPAATSDRSEWRLVPSVVFQEFSSEVRCKDAKTKIETTLKQAGDRLKGGLNELQKAGAADPAQIIIAYNVECVPK
jgi:hypothetical protein